MAVSLELAISAIRAGRKAEGRQLLNLLIQQNPNDEMAWLWMSSVVDNNEQRARCLYHVLAINPESQLARRGLQVLGVVVSDSRPVKIPRDSQPIRLSKPSANNSAAARPQAEQPKTPAQQKQPQSQTPPNKDASSKNRGSFLLDPQAITQELPFVPVRPPLQQKEVVKASPNVLALKVDEDDAGSDATPAVATEEPASAQTAPAAGQPTGQTNAEAPTDPEQTQELPVPEAGAAGAAENVAGSPEKADDPSPPETPPVAATSAQAAATPQAETLKPADEEKQPSPEDDSAVHSTATQQMASPDIPSTATQQMAQAVDGSEQKPSQQPQPVPGTRPYSPNVETFPPPAQPALDNNSPREPKGTRPSQPVLINFQNPNPGAGQADPNQGQFQAGQQPPPHAGGTVPMQGQPQAQPQHPSQPPPGMHSNSTMEMPVPPPNQYHRPPSEPVPVVHHNPMAMIPMGQYYPPPPGMSIHSNATMMMPTMTEAEAKARLAAGQSIPTASAAAMPLQNASNWPGYDFGAYQQQPYEAEDEDEEDEDEINILAIVIFGTLSMTALGGLGMLILLIVTSSPTPAG